MKVTFSRLAAGAVTAAILGGATLLSAAPGFADDSGQQRVGLSNAASSKPARKPIAIMAEQTPPRRVVPHPTLGGAIKATSGCDSRCQLTRHFENYGYREGRVFLPTYGPQPPNSGSNS